MKKLMILGAGYSQLPLYRAAKRIGVSTIAASTKGDWPGFLEADEKTYTDISDPEAVLKAVREFKADGIATCCVDVGVRALGYACEKTGLIGLSQKAGEICSDKYKMKEAFVQGGVKCARHICIHNEQELREALNVFSFPVVLKAVDLMGSRGIFRCDTEEDVFTRYKDTMKATRKEYCLIEEFIQGTLMGCEALMHEGKLVYCMPDNTVAFQSSVPTPVGHSVPYKKQKELGEEVKRQVLLAVKAVGLDNCPVNCDLIEKDGEIYVVEITGRAGATCLPEIVGLLYGLDYYEVIARLALGLPFEEMFSQKGRWQAVHAQTLFSKESGIVKAIVNENEALSNVAELSFNIKPGDYVRKYENGRDRIGQVIIGGSSMEECKRVLDKVLSKIGIEFTA